MPIIISPTLADAADTKAIAEATTAILPPVDLPSLVTRAGQLTSEYKLARQGGIMGLIVFGIGALCEFLPYVQSVVPPAVSQEIAKVLAYSGVALAALNASGYGINRAIVKKAEVQAAADVHVANITAASYAGTKG